MFVDMDHMRNLFTLQFVCYFVEIIFSIIIHNLRVIVYFLGHIYSDYHFFFGNGSKFIVFFFKFQLQFTSFFIIISLNLELIY